MIRSLIACLVFCLALIFFDAGSVMALDLPSSAKSTSKRVSNQDRYELPVAPFADGHVLTIPVDGVVDRRSWRIDGTATTTRQLMDPLRMQLEQDGYDVLLDCDTNGCGGFDFRFGIEVIPAPDMYVDLGDFRFLSATGINGQGITLLVSRGGSTAFVQVIQVTPDGQSPVEISNTGTVAPLVIPSGGSQVADHLRDEGYVVLDDLVFATGANTLGKGPYDSLANLAAFLTGNPTFNVVFVGHTDSIGSLEANVKLSKARATAVRDYMTHTYGIADNRVAADGMGYLSPIASNLTADGRKANRRVEAVLLHR